MGMVRKAPTGNPVRCGSSRITLCNLMFVGEDFKQLSTVTVQFRIL